MKTLSSTKKSFIRGSSFLFTLLLALISIFAGCTNQRNEHHPEAYFPVQVGNTWIFKGDIPKMEITSNLPGEQGDYITMSCYDSGNVLLWKEKYQHLKDQLYFESFEPNSSILPRVIFDPALPLAPFSSKPGHKIVLEGKETHLDSIKSETQIVVTYEIENIEDVTVPAGTFRNCIKMKINVKYQQFAVKPFFIGDQYWWFAPMVGPVKYDLPSAYGELTELKLGKSRLLSTP